LKQSHSLFGRVNLYSNEYTLSIAKTYLSLTSLFFQKAVIGLQTLFMHFSVPYQILDENLFARFVYFLRDHFNEVEQFLI